MPGSQDLELRADLGWRLPDRVYTRVSAARTQMHALCAAPRASARPSLLGWLQMGTWVLPVFRGKRWHCGICAAALWVWVPRNSPPSLPHQASTHPSRHQSACGPRATGSRGHSGLEAVLWLPGERRPQGSGPRRGAGLWVSCSLALLSLHAGLLLFRFLHAAGGTGCDPDRAQPPVPACLPNRNTGFSLHVQERGQGSAHCDLQAWVPSCPLPWGWVVALQSGEGNSCRKRGHLLWEEMAGRPTLWPRGSHTLSLHSHPPTRGALPGTAYFPPNRGRPGPLDCDMGGDLGHSPLGRVHLPEFWSGSARCLQPGGDARATCCQHV